MSMTMEIRFMNIKRVVDLEEEEAFNGTKCSDYMQSYQDKVNNPMHYTVGGYEAIDVIKAKLTPEEYRGACKANVLKYLMRANYKGHHDQDLEKALYYMKELVNALESKEIREPTIPSGDEKPF